MSKPIKLYIKIWIFYCMYFNIKKKKLKEIGEDGLGTLT